MLKGAPARVVIVACFAAIAAGCADSASDSAADGDSGSLSELSAEEAWTELESRLLEVESLQIQFVVVSEGAVESQLRGAVALLGGGALSLSADGQFAGQPQALRLSADGQQLVVGEAPGAAPVAQPPGLVESVIVGFTRMGILHNLARLTGGATPDHMEAGVREWVTVDSLSWGAPETVEGRSARPLDFVIRVEGEAIGSARLFIDDESDLPLNRQQTVRFPDGDLIVTESYEFF